jgi:hypothetical protein
MTRKPGTAQDKRKKMAAMRAASGWRSPLTEAQKLCGFFDSAVAPGTLTVTVDCSGYAGLRKRGHDHHAIAECGIPK